MRITFVLPGYPAPIGGFKVVYEYANQLVARNHDVTVVHTYFLRNIDPPLNYYRCLRRKVGNLLTRISRPNFQWLLVDKRVRMLFVREPIAKYVPDGDIIFATAWQTSEYVDSYPSSKGERFYLVMDFPPYMGSKEKIETSWKQSFRKITISNWLYEKVVSVAGTQNLVNIPIGVASDRFRIARDINGRDESVAMIYSRGGYKGGKDGIKALGICRKNRPILPVNVIGPKLCSRQIPSWMDYKSNIPEEELVYLYNQTRIFLCSSLAEGFALPSAEAMACGCAVVSTDCGGNREYAEDGVTAFLSSPGDPEALAANVLKLLKDDNLRIKLAKAGHRRIQEFTWERSTNLLEQFLKGQIKCQP